ncbi:MAG: cytochrome d ubiquinol oxidase subunit II [Myxococcota bacterium]
MSALPDLIASVALAALALYMVSGGADFGGGVWDLFATGPRRERQRVLIETSIAPIWEANHVWLILVIVLLFTAFPRGFADILTGLHVPLSLMLLGIIARGSAFVFRHYGQYDARGHARWGTVFAVSSLVTPVFLGACLATLATGDMLLIAGRPQPGTLTAWLGLLPLAAGLFTLALCAYLAAVYLTVEADDPSLKDDFRRRALITGALVAATAAASAAAAHHAAAPFAKALFASPWSPRPPARNRPRRHRRPRRAVHPPLPPRPRPRRPADPAHRRRLRPRPAPLPRPPPPHLRRRRRPRRHPTASSPPPSPSAPSSSSLPLHHAPRLQRRFPQRRGRWVPVARSSRSADRRESS